MTLTKSLCSLCFDFSTWIVCFFVCFLPPPSCIVLPCFSFAQLFSFIWKIFCYSRSLTLSLLLPSVEMHHPHFQLKNSPSPSQGCLLLSENSPSHHPRADFCCQDISPPSWSSPCSPGSQILSFPAALEDAAGSGAG